MDTIILTNVVFTNFESAFQIFHCSIDNLNWVTSVPIGIPLCILGIIGNTISIAVWLRFIRKKIGTSPSSAIYFVALGVVDNGLLVFFLLTDALPKAIGSKMSDSYGYGWFYAYIGFPFFFFFIVASIWMLVGLTINRFIMVRFPVKVFHFKFEFPFPHFSNYASFF